MEGDVSWERRCLALSLSWEYLTGGELICLAGTSQLLRQLLRNCVKRLHMNLAQDQAGLSCVRVLFPTCGELELVGNRTVLFSRLKQARQLSQQLHKLRIRLDDFCEADELHMDGLALGALIGGFSSSPSLVELQLENLGPFSPRGLATALLPPEVTTISSLQVLFLDGCGTLLDLALQFVVLHSHSLVELHVSSCASLKSLVLQSQSLRVVEVAKCFQLESVNVELCSRIEQLLVPWTVNLAALPAFPVQQLIKLSLQAGASLPFVVIPSCFSLTWLDLSYCTTLEYIILTECHALVHLACEFSPKLHTIELHHAHSLVKLNLSLLRKLRSVVVTEAWVLKKIHTQGCPDLEHPPVLRA
ncbi:hypothetical protein BASA81_006569 [Batrachochytrium salamandrivorans]|nr:hypothetical protein BASA81_006569 [Batrachochytrium salamandrivorans]